NARGGPEGKARVLGRAEPAAEGVGAALGFEVERDDRERERFDGVGCSFDVRGVVLEVRDARAEPAGGAARVAGVETTEDAEEPLRVALGGVVAGHGGATALCRSQAANVPRTGALRISPTRHAPPTSPCPKCRRCARTCASSCARPARVLQCAASCLGWATYHAIAATASGSVRPTYFAAAVSRIIASCDSRRPILRWSSRTRAVNARPCSWSSAPTVADLGGGRPVISSISS